MADLTKATAIYVHVTLMPSRLSACHISCRIDKSTLYGALQHTCGAGVGVQIEEGLLLAVLLQGVELHVWVPCVAVLCPLNGHAKQLLHQLHVARESHFSLTVTI